MKSLFQLQEESVLDSLSVNPYRVPLVFLAGFVDAGADGGRLISLPAGDGEKIPLP